MPSCFQPWLFGEKSDKKQVKLRPKPPVHEKLAVNENYQPVYLKQARFQTTSATTQVSAKYWVGLSRLVFDNLGLTLGSVSCYLCFSH